MDSADPLPPVTHRATYTLERGVWLATCRVCGWRVSDLQRRRAAAAFRLHIQSARDVALSGMRPNAGPLVGPADA